MNMEYSIQYALHTYQNAINNTQFVFIWFLIFSFFINASFWYYLTFSFDAIWFQWSVWKSICLKMFLQLLEMCLFRVRSISEWKKKGSVSYCIIENWWTESKFWICFFQSNGSKCGLFSISLSPFCLRNVLMESAFVLLQIWCLFSLAFSCEINAWDLIQTCDSILWAFLILFTRCGLFLCQMKSKKYIKGCDTNLI